MKTIIVLGHDGYIGHALTLRLLNKGYKVIGIDNGLRRRAVMEMGSFSATPIEGRDIRAEQLQDIGDSAFFNMDISSGSGYLELEKLIKEYKPDCIVNLAQQPSAPYSQIDVHHASLTAINNIASTINVLWAIKNVQDIVAPHLVQIGTMGEYKPDVGIKIPEGKFDMVINKSIVKDVLFPRSGGSFYHTSKISATYFIEYACRTFDICATDIMQGIVYGNWTPEIEQYNLHTRLDSDEAFGTVVNRFIVQAVLEHPLTIYGKGEHKRGFLALNDSVQCLMLAIENDDYKGYRVWNQLDTVHSMLEVASLVRSAALKYHLGPIIQHIDTPRVENTDDFYYNPIVDKLKTLGFKPTRSIEDEADYAISVIKKNTMVHKLAKVVMPEIKWR